MLVEMLSQTSQRTGSMIRDFISSPFRLLQAVGLPMLASSGCAHHRNMIRGCSKAQLILADREGIIKNVSFGDIAGWIRNTLAIDNGHFPWSCFITQG